MLLCTWARNPISCSFLKIPVLAILPSLCRILNFILLTRSFTLIHKHAFISLITFKKKNPFFIPLFPLAIAPYFCSHAQHIFLKKLVYVYGHHFLISHSLLHLTSFHSYHANKIVLIEVGRDLCMAPGSGQFSVASSLTSQCHWTQLIIPSSMKC